MARGLSGVFVLLVAVFVTAFFVGGRENSAGPLSADDFGALAVSLTMLAGLVVAWKWELAGGALALTACAAFAIVNWRAFNGPGIAIPISAMLFVASWWMRARLGHRRTQSSHVCA